MSYVKIVVYPIIGCTLLHASNDSIASSNYPLSVGLIAVGLLLIMSFGKLILKH